MSPPDILWRSKQWTVLQSRDGSMPITAFLLAWNLSEKNLLFYQLDFEQLGPELAGDEQAVLD